MVAAEVVIVEEEETEMTEGHRLGKLHNNFAVNFITNNKRDLDIFPASTKYLCEMFPHFSPVPSSQRPHRYLTILISADQPIYCGEFQMFQYHTIIFADGYTWHGQCSRCCGFQRQFVNDEAVYLYRSKGPYHPPEKKVPF